MVSMRSFGSVLVPVMLAASGMSVAFAQDEERNTCLSFGQVEAVHQLGVSDMLLEVDGGTTLYHISVEDRCFDSDAAGNIRIEGSGEDSCMRTTDKVHFGRRVCDITGFSLIETQDQLDALLSRPFD